MPGGAIFRAGENGRTAGDGGDSPRLPAANV
jgi:hypothetical protein